MRIIEQMAKLETGKKTIYRIQTFCRQIDWQSMMSDLSAKNNYRLAVLF